MAVLDHSAGAYSLHVLANVEVLFGSDCDPLLRSGVRVKRSATAAENDRRTTVSAQKQPDSGSLFSGSDAAATTDKRADRSFGRSQPTQFPAPSSVPTLAHAEMFFPARKGAIRAPPMIGSPVRPTEFAVAGLHRPSRALRGLGGHPPTPGPRRRLAMPATGGDPSVKSRRGRWPEPAATSAGNGAVRKRRGRTGGRTQRCRWWLG